MAQYMKMKGTYDLLLRKHHTRDDMEFKNAFWNLDALLTQKGLSKTQLSYRAEVSHTQINRICKGETVRIDLGTLARICTVLDCSPSELIILEDPKKS